MKPCDLHCGGPFRVARSSFASCSYVWFETDFYAYDEQHASSRGVYTTVINVDYVRRKCLGSSHPDSMGRFFPMLSPSLFSTGFSNLERAILQHSESTAMRYGTGSHLSHYGLIAKNEANNHAPAEGHQEDSSRHR